MSALPRLKKDHWHVACGVCRRRAIGIGYAPRSSSRRARPILWLCGDERCSSLAATVYAMSEKELDAYEARARHDAGNEAGAYLDEIGETDLAKLSVEQWIEFTTRMIIGFERSLRRQLTEHEAPF